MNPMNMKRQGIEYCQQDEYGAKKDIKKLEKWCKQQGHEYSYIHHDRDTYTAVDEAENADHKAGTPKPKHWHMMIRFVGTEYSINDLVRLHGIGEIGKYTGMWRTIGTKGGKFDNNYENAKAYLVHATKQAMTDNKTAYNPEEVKASYNYVDFLEGYRKESEKIEAKAKKKEDKDSYNKKLAEFMEKIYNHEIPKYQSKDKYFELVCDLPQQYERDKRLIKSAYETRFEQDVARGMERQIAVIYIYGNGGTGKSTFAEVVANMVGKPIKDYNDTYKMQAGKGGWEGYSDQSVVLWNDFNDSTMSYRTFLQNMEPTSPGSKDARYKNVDASMAEVVYITADKDVHDIYLQALPTNREQIYRRMAMMFKFTDQTIEIWNYSPEIKDYYELDECENPLKDIQWETQSKDKYVELLTASLNTMTAIKNMENKTVKSAKDLSEKVKKFMANNGDILQHGGNSFLYEQKDGKLGWVPEEERGADAGGLVTVQDVLEMLKKPEQVIKWVAEQKALRSKIEEEEKERAERAEREEAEKERIRDRSPLKKTERETLKMYCDKYPKIKQEALALSNSEKSIGEIDQALRELIRFGETLDDI